jgi:integrase
LIVYRRERTRRTHLPPKMPYRPIETMNNTGWQRARNAAGLGDLHVHDLRHTAGMRLREAGVSQETISDLFWHRKASMTEHYSLAQLVELHGALERIKADNGVWNKSLATLRLEHRAARGDFRSPVADRLSPPKVPPERKTA